ncbi:thiamine-monophosphate kinase [Stygiolobus caldivivus]|uniref:Thiamine-monophosphate kinase n=2 Tax=Stygiolobus caldivivus TaxID=2824673 RepID=A0A8D5U7S9_9CREN|nr:thiamine-monophosphate kinase [Stygiolobus caldivivus]
MDDVYIDGKSIYKIDGFQLSYSFPFMRSYDLGWKAVTSTVSDIIAKGGIPDIFLASIGIPKVKINELEELIEGISDAIKYYGGKYVGGDLNSSDGSGWVDVVGIGKVSCDFSRKISSQDYIIISNPIGYTSIVFISYLHSWNITLSNKFLNKIRHPIVNKNIVKIINKYCSDISYSTDISDGLVISLYNIIERKNVSIELDILPFDDEVEYIAARNSVDDNQLLKYSGEEFETLLVVSKDKANEIANEMKRFGLNPMIIGKVVKQDGLSTNNKKYLFYKGRIVEKTGWDNFIGWF